MNAGLSIIIAAQPGQDILGCLESLRSQGVLQTIVVVAPGAAPLAPSAADIVIHSDERSLPMLLAAGLAHATSDLIAMTEAHCRFAAGWVEAVCSAQQRTGAAVIGGAVEPAPGLTPLEYGLFYADYAAFLLPFASHQTADLPGSNIVFKRQALSDFRQPGFWKTFHVRELALGGERMWLEPTVVVEYGRRITLRGLLRRRYDHGRCFGAMRAERSALTKRFAYAVVAPLLPFVLFARVARLVVPKQRHQFRFARVVHWVLLSIVVWIVGETIGTLRGGGASCSRL